MKTLLGETCNFVQDWLLPVASQLAKLRPMKPVDQDALSPTDVSVSSDCVSNDVNDSKFGGNAATNSSHSSSDPLSVPLFFLLISPTDSNNCQQHCQLNMSTNHSNDASKHCDKCGCVKLSKKLSTFADAGGVGCGSLRSWQQVTAAACDGEAKVESTNCGAREMCGPWCVSSVDMNSSPTVAGDFFDSGTAETRYSGLCICDASHVDGNAGCLEPLYSTQCYLKIVRTAAPLLEATTEQPNSSHEAYGSTPLSPKHEPNGSASDNVKLETVKSPEQIPDNLSSEVGDIATPICMLSNPFHGEVAPASSISVDDKAYPDTRHPSTNKVDINHVILLSKCNVRIIAVISNYGEHVLTML